MKKILIIANNSSGLFDFRHELIETIKKKAIIYIIVPDGDKVDLLRNISDKVFLIPIDRRGKNPLRDFKLLCTYRKIIKMLKPNLVITYTIKPNIYGGMVCQFLKIPYAVNITGLGTAIENKGLLADFVCMLYRFALKKAKVVFFENAYNCQKMVELKVIPEHKTKVLHGAGVNLQEFANVPYPIENSEVKFLFVGRLMKEKGIDELLDAAKKLKKEYGNRFILDLVGYFEDSYKEVVMKLVKDDIVKFHGYQLDVKPFYNKCNVVVLPSYHEGMSNVLLEGAAIGRPLITSDIPGCREAVVNEKNGYLCRAKDADDLYKKMKKFMHLDVNSRSNMGIYSRKHVEENFDKRQVINETMQELFK